MGNNVVQIIEPNINNESNFKGRKAVGQGKEKIILNLDGQGNLERNPSMKKIANEPKLLREWLYENAWQVKQKKVVREFEELANLIGLAAERNQVAVEYRARRKATSTGLVASKGAKPYYSENLGLFQLINPRTSEVVAGFNFDMTANEVLDYCASLNHAIFEKTHIPRELYREDPERYWELKEATVDGLYANKLVNAYGEVNANDEAEDDDEFYTFPARSIRH